MISVLLPSRGRPTEFKRLYDSAMDTAKGPIEFVVYRDIDDPTEYHQADNITFIKGERIVLSQMWNECYRQAKGPYYMHCGDDIIFRTPGWDEIVMNAFPEDKIAFVFGNDGYWGNTFGTHGFIHKNWIEAVGYFVPPYFSSDYNDTWLNDVAKLIGRRLYVDILTEHMHFAFGKGPLDQTHQERLDRHQADNVDQLYVDKSSERDADAEKLRRCMTS